MSRLRDVVVSVLVAWVAWLAVVWVLVQLGVLK